MASPSGITAFVFCHQCLEDLPDGFSLAEYTRVECGFVPGHLFQVWCMRHQIEVLTVKRAPGQTWMDVQHEGGN